MRSHAHRGAHMIVGPHVLLQNHNIRNDLIPSEFGNWRALIIGCTSSSLLRSRTNVSSAQRRCADE